MLLTVLEIGWCRLHSKIPLASTNSMAISAACHREDDHEAAFKPIMWGVLHAPGGMPQAGLCQHAQGPAAQEASGDLARATNSSQQLSPFLSLFLRHLILTHEKQAVGPIAQRTGRLYTYNSLRKLTNRLLSQSPRAHHTGTRAQSKRHPVRLLWPHPMWTSMRRAKRQDTAIGHFATAASTFS